MENLTYLHDIPLADALKRFQDALEAAGLWGMLGGEEITLNEDACGRVLAEPVWARLSSPHYHAAAMDGFALRSAQTAGAMPTAPLTLLLLSQATYVDTGDALPEWADSVIPIENVEPLDELGQISIQGRSPYAIRIRSAVTPWSNVRAMGEDIVATQLVLPAGRCLRPADLGAIAASGHSSVVVSRRPRVAVIPTGSELIPIGQTARPGEIIEFNSLVLAAQVHSWGGLAVRYPIVPDHLEEISRQVSAAMKEHDLILLVAGSSAGSEDYSARVVQNLGRLLVHGVAVRPGHPVILGMLGEESAGSPPNPGWGFTSVQSERPVPIIGVPGYPVSAALTGEIFLQPLISRWLGQRPASPVTIKASLTRKITSPPGDDDYVRVAVGRVGPRLLVAPLSRGAGLITSLSRADGIAILPRGSQGLPAGADVDVQLYIDPQEIDQTIFAIGSHDIILDVLAQFLAGLDRRLVSANVGSLGGLIALKRGEAHLAGSHLLDPETGEYNLAYIGRHIPEVPLVLLTLAGRKQGLMVKSGNPKEICVLEDLARPGIRFVNRQRGSGTRVLLDYHLSREGIEAQAIDGYDQEEYTHLGVAAAVASGRADAGLGIAAAAQALELDFWPLFDERYDLLIPEEHYHSELLSPLHVILRDSSFRQTVASMPGYDISAMGREMHIDYTEEGVK